MTMYAGIGWSERGFDLACCTAGGEATMPVEHYPAGQVRELTSRLLDLQRLQDTLICVVESTNGMLDGAFNAAGLTVYRADPSSLPPRPALASVDAQSLARAAATRPSELTPVTIRGGSLTGREPDYDRDVETRSEALGTLLQEGRFLPDASAAGTDRVVALTFDDGPNPPWTNRILDVLDRYAVPATFFCVGLHAIGFTEEVARMAEAGHCLGNHTWSHPFLHDLSDNELEVQLNRTEEALEQAAGVAGSRLFRPPYGSGSSATFRWVRRSESFKVVFWDVDTNDWAMPGAPAIADAVVSQTRPGSIVLMHDGGGDRSQTAEALPAAIEGLLERGYRFVRVDQMNGHQ